MGMYARFLLLDEVERVFRSLPARDLVAWNACIEAYVECGCGEEALACLDHMQAEGVSPSGASFAHGLKACAAMGAKEKGEAMFHAVSAQGLLDRDAMVGNSLIHMYASVGMLATARDVFERLPMRDVVSWNCLITGFAQAGECREAFLALNRMVNQEEEEEEEEEVRKAKPNAITFVSVLGACSHEGLICEARLCLKAMSSDYGLVLMLEHYNCLIDLLGRSGQLNTALAMLNALPCRANAGIWRSLMGACQKWHDAEIAKEAFEAASCFDRNDAMLYVSLGNIYAAAAAAAEDDMQEAALLNVV
jgi:pentatricopeptide repeat protein